MLMNYVTNVRVVAISVFITQAYGSRAAVLGFCEVCCLVSSVKCRTQSLLRVTDGGGCIGNDGSCNI